MFLAYCLKDEVVISHEHQKFEWLPFKEATKQLKFENLIKQLDEAESLLGRDQ